MQPNTVTSQYEESEGAGISLDMMVFNVKLKFAGALYSAKKQDFICKFLVFHRGVGEVFALVGCYAVSVNEHWLMLCNIKEE